MAAAPSSEQDKGVNGPRSKSTGAEPLGQNRPDTWGDRGGDGHGARGGWDDLEERDSRIYTTMCKTDSQWGYAI